MASSAGYGTIVANGTTVIKSSDSILERIISVNPGTTWVLSIYDASTAATATAAQLRWTKTLAANDNIEVNIQMQNGITVINTGTAGTAVITWKKI